MPKELTQAMPGIKEQQEEEKPVVQMSFMQQLPTFDSLLRDETFMRGLTNVINSKVWRTDNIATMMVVCQMEILRELRKLNENLEEPSSGTRVAKPIKK